MKSQQVEVKGAVTKPGTFPFYRGMTVTDALFLANGITSDTALDRALLFRLDPHTYHEVVINISLRNALAHQPSDNITLENHDQLFVFRHQPAGRVSTGDRGRGCH